jgi:hypothetical protein
MGRLALKAVRGSSHRLGIDAIVDVARPAARDTGQLKL